MKSSIQSFIILIVFSMQVFASTWYVSTTGSDAKDGKTSANAFASPSKGISSAKAGDTVLLAGGTYQVSVRINISISGTSAAKISLLAENPYTKRAVLDFSSQGYGSSNQGIVLSANYWYIKGIDIVKAGDNGMLVDGGSYNTIEWCSFQENSDAGLQLRHGAAHDLVLNCDSWWNYDSATFGGNADGFSPKLDVGDSVIFRGCRSWGNSDDGWDGYLKTAGTSYPDNIVTIIQNSWAFDNGYYHGDPASAKNNGSMNGNGFKMGGSPNADQRHPHVVTNCLSFYNKAKQYDQNNNRGSMTILNCTAFNSANTFVISEPLAVGSVLTVKNCVSAGGGSVSLLAAAVLTTNSWMTPFSESNADFVSTDTAGVRSPRKADGSLPDVNFMHLATGSGLIDAGTNVGLPYNGSKPDLGCFETGTIAIKNSDVQFAKSNNDLRVAVCQKLGNIRVALTIEQSTEVTLAVYDMSGKLVVQSAVMHCKDGSADYAMSSRMLRSGAYVCTVRYGENSIAKRFVY